MDTTINYVDYRSPKNGKTTMKFTFAPESKPLDGYTIKRAIERGGFGEVYYALSDAGKEVALKLVQQNMDVEVRGVSQCLNLKHPNLVTIFDIRTDADGDHWIVMEYVSGRHLNKVLSDYPHGMPVEKIQHWLSGIAAGTSFLHDRGIVHRDLKPANIYTEGGFVKIGDVGLSKFISPSRRSAHTQSVGTVYYMAPEVAHGRYGREDDVYSLGIILYEMLTGRVPFDGETTAEILMKHLTQKPDLSALPSRLRPVLAHALEKDPQKRTPSVKVLEQEFTNAVLGLENAVAVSRTPSTAGPADTSSPPSSDTATRQAPSGGNVNSATASFAPQDVAPAPNTQSDIDTCWQRPSQSRRGLYFVIALCVGLGILSMSSRAGLFLRPVVVGAVATIGLAAIIRHLVRSPDQRQFEHARRSPNPMPLNAASDRNRVATHPVKVHRSVPVSNRRGGYHNTALSPNTRRSISWRQRVAELTGSMACASLVTVVITAGLGGLTTFFESPNAVGLFATTTLFGSWAVIFGSKMWEGRKADPFPRRLTLLCLAGLVGTAAYFLDSSLMVDLVAADSKPTSGAFQSIGTQPLFDAQSEPTLAAYLAFFGSLFFLRRWWWHADSFRPKRLRVTSLLLTLSLSYLVSIIWGFPVSWSMVWAVAISSVVQISSVWVPPVDRLEYMEGSSHAA